MIRRFAFAALVLGAVACGDDGDDDNKTENKKPDASVGQADAAVPYVPTPNAITNLGSKCSGPADCMGVTGKAECVKSVSILISSINYPGGACTAKCQEDVECGGGQGVCPLGQLVGMAGGAGVPAGLPINLADLSRCQLKCTQNSDCRADEGYRCVTLGEALPTFGSLLEMFAGSAGGAGDAGAGLTQKFCFPPAPATADAGVPDAATPADASTTADASTDASDDAATTPDAAQ